LPLPCRAFPIIARISCMAPANVHLFYGEPAGIAAFLGAELSNRGGVVLYQYDVSRGTYENWGPLRHGYF